MNRRDTRYLDFVESFSEASHHLLLQSGLRKANGDTDRLRQYTSIFINITHGDKNEQYMQVRKLIDAGIFNLQGGPEASRTNRQGAKPQQQFKLVFRKLYGVNKHMGLSSSDRFELSGKPLEEWLKNPKKGKNILINNLNPISKEVLPQLLAEVLVDDDLNKNDTVQQFNLFSENLNEDLRPDITDFSFILDKLPVITETTSDHSIGDVNIAIIGLGFEDAALSSAKSIREINPEKVIFISFNEKGYTDEILLEFEEYGPDRKIFVSYENIDEILPFLANNNILCDITGLPKGLIFNLIRPMYLNNESFNISLTTPEFEYPLDSDVKNFFDLNADSDSSVLLSEMSSILKGEDGPYSLVSLLPHYTNISEPRVLFAFASAKHERLYTLLDERDYEQINVIVTDGDLPREKLARTSAEFSLRKFNSAIIHYLNQNDISDVLNQIAKDYYTYFISNNFPFELGLTGNKIQTVASAIFSSVFKISQCWYVKPEKWDKDRFSKGKKEFKIMHVRSKK
ncbi:hypothetical protein D3C72_1103580 [compost metagenome]